MRMLLTNDKKGLLLMKIITIINSIYLIVKYFKEKNYHKINVVLNFKIYIYITIFFK